MHVNHGVPFRIGHVFEGSIAQNAGIVDQNVQAAEVVYGALDHGRCGFVVGDRAVGGSSLPTGSFDFVNHGIRHAGAAAGTVPGTAKIVNHHRSAMLGQQ